jgi:hypothetical protein
MKPRWLGIFLIGWMLLGVVLLGFGVKELVDSRAFSARAVGANARVVDVTRVVEHERRTSGGDNDNVYYVDVPYFYPVVEFVTAREQIVRFRPGGSARAYQVGDSVRILYDPANPPAARPDTNAGWWETGAILIFIGLCFVVTGGAVYFLPFRLGWSATSHPFITS